MHALIGKAFNYGDHRNAFAYDSKHNKKWIYWLCRRCGTKTEKVDERAHFIWPAHHQACPLQSQEEARKFYIDHMIMVFGPNTELWRGNCISDESIERIVTLGNQNLRD